MNGKRLARRWDPSEPPRRDGTPCGLYGTARLSTCRTCCKPKPTIATKTSRRQRGRRRSYYSSVEVFITAVIAMNTVFLPDKAQAFTADSNKPLVSSSSSHSDASLQLRSMTGGGGHGEEVAGEKKRRIGFVGCGTIAAAIARGIATQDRTEIGSIAVSRRSEAKSRELSEEFPKLVSVLDDNQEILDRSDVVFLCVLPDQASPTLRALSFDSSRHSLVSLVSTTKIEDLIRDSGLEPMNVSKMICLPSIARHEGVALHCCPEAGGPDAAFLTSLFDSCGGVVTLQDESELQASMMTTCVMGPLYGVMRRNRDWLTTRSGLSKGEASKLVIRQYAGAVEQALRFDDDPDRLDDLIEEQTRGGLNEQALSNLDELGGLEMLDRIMEAVVSRIRGESDGSVPS